MFVKVKKPGTVYYDFEQKANIANRVTEVKSTSLIRELIRTGDIIEVEKPSEAVLKEYAKEDKEIQARKEKSKVNVAKPLDVKLKQANAKIVTLSDELAEANENLVAANAEIADLKDQLSKVGDPKSKEDLAKAKKDAVDPKKETTKATNGEKA